MNDKDFLYEEARAYVIEHQRVSVSTIQRKFRIGYNRSARLVIELEHQGVISKPGYDGSRKVTIPKP